MTSREPFAAERWFLSRGLPAVLRPGALLRRVWSRSAPALAGFAVFAANSVGVVALAGKHSIDIIGNPTLTETFVLALLVLDLPLAGLIGWLVSRSSDPRKRAITADASTVIIVLGAVFGGPSPRPIVNLVTAGIVVMAMLLLTATGVGSILGWAVQNTLSNLAAMRGMFVRSLPVVLLTFLVFFNGYVWLMAAIIGRGRLWVAIGFLFLIAAAFLVSATLEQVRPIVGAPGDVNSGEDLDRDKTSLAGTPFEHMSDGSNALPVSAVERVNVVFVVVAAQLSQVFTVALSTGAIFLVLGLIVLSPALLEAWARGGATPNCQLLGMTLPIPNALVQTTMMLTAITFMYLAAKAVSDREYRAQFLDPLMDQLRLTLVARQRYRSQGAKR
jgi:hypothetical protein